MEIILIRHGESEANARGMVQGRGDYRLNDAGRRQARLTAQALRDLPPERVFASPLVRARETAEIIAQSHQAEIVLLDDLLEYDLGAFEGLTPAEIDARFPHVPEGIKQGIPFHRLAPGAETDDQVQDRAQRALAAITAAGPDRVFVVSHLGLLERLLRLAVKEFNLQDYIREPKRHLQNCSITRLLLSPDGNRALCVNDVSHLQVKS
jgi:broad specificity phosphatase PhoE